MFSCCVQLTKILRSEGHIFNQELAFILTSIVVHPMDFALKCEEFLRPRSLMNKWVAAEQH